MTESRTSPHGEPRGLDPARDPVTWEAAVRSIVEAAEPELARRAARAGPLVVMLRWSRPVLSAAAALVVLASATLLTTGLGPPTTSQASEQGVEGYDGPVLAEALMSPTVAAWVLADRIPTLEEAVEAMEGAER